MDTMTYQSCKINIHSIKPNLSLSQFEKQGSLFQLTKMAWSDGKYSILYLTVIWEYFPAPICHENSWKSVNDNDTQWQAMSMTKPVSGSRGRAQTHNSSKVQNIERVTVSPIKHHYNTWLSPGTCIETVQLIASLNTPLIPSQWQPDW